MKRPSDIIVVGGGAAGLMAAGAAASCGAAVALLERNPRPGRKLGITGKGRCNLTNDCGVQQVLENTPTNGKFLYSALGAFPPSAVMEFFRAQGVELKTERGNRVFPVSDRAGDVVDALEGYCRRGGVEVIRARARRVLLRDGRAAGVLTDAGEFYAPRVILCTGGASYPATGSTGDGYAMASELGHTIVPPKPSLVPLESPDRYCGRMQGFAPRNVRLKVLGGGKVVYEDFGEMLFTHFGVSGPLILSASAHMRDFGREKYSLSIDFKPALDEKKLDARILRDFEKYRNRDIANALTDLEARSMIPVLVELSGIPAETRANAVTREQRRALLELLKAFPVAISGPRPIAEAVVTSGGVDVREIRPKTMESRLAPGVYFAGELIDVDAYTGGFNLQIAWSTARAAALAACAAEGKGNG